jgi:hypothetical protein
MRSYTIKPNPTLKINGVIVADGALSPIPTKWCDWHGSQLAGGSPAIAL